MDLRIGDKVFVTDEDLEGRVISINENIVLIESNEGFEYEFQKKHLFKVNDDKSIEFTRKEFSAFDEDKEDEIYQISRTIEFVGKKPIFDLHIEDLAPNMNFQSQHDTLLFQLDFVKEVMSEASRKRIRNMVFVHGIGKGRLREEIRKLLRESYTKIEFFDGNYGEFGIGATEIIIHQF